MRVSYIIGDYRGEHRLARRGQRARGASGSTNRQTLSTHSATPTARSRCNAVTVVVLLRSIAIANSPMLAPGLALIASIICSSASSRAATRELTLRGLRWPLALRLRSSPSA